MAFENDPEGYSMAQGYAGHDFDKPKQISIDTLYEYGAESWTLTDFTALIEEAIEKIPVDKCAEAVVELEGGYEESTYLRISYQGMESPETVAARVNRCEEYVAGRRSGERAIYERLKAKFG